MARKSLTKDEMFLVKLYEMAKTYGGPYEEVDRYIVGVAIGQKEKAVDNMVKIMAQANFIKKGDKENVYLTPHGESLVLDLM